MVPIPTIIRRPVMIFVFMVGGMARPNTMFTCGYSAVREGQCETGEPEMRKSSRSSSPVNTIHVSLSVRHAFLS